MQELDTNEMVVKSPGFARVVELAKRVAASSANVLIMGESGTGKEVIARLIHQSSARSGKPFIAINCSAIPETLLESELFGYARGAYTGAIDKKPGLFEEAEGGTIFLDEIGDVSLLFQAKLLRVIQERKLKRLGENQARKLDIRIISATHKNLKKEIGEEKFREDFYFRIAVFPLHIPPLRERREEIISLSEFFMKKYAGVDHLEVTGFTNEAVNCLLNNPWRGNIRELENTIERAVLMRGNGLIDVCDLSMDELPPANNTFFADVFKGNQPLVPLHEFAENYILHVLKQSGGAKDKTAKLLGIDRKTLYRKIHDIESRNGLKAAGL